MVKAMYQVKAREHLKLLECNSFSTIKKEDRDKIHRKWVKVGYPDHFEKKALKTDDMVLY